MQRTDFIKEMANSIIYNETNFITNEEFEILLSMSESELEKDFYIELYNFFLQKKSEEVIKNGKF